MHWGRVCGTEGLASFSFCTGRSRGAHACPLQCPCVRLGALGTPGTGRGLLGTGSSHAQRPAPSRHHRGENLPRFLLYHRNTNFSPGGEFCASSLPRGLPRGCPSSSPRLQPCGLEAPVIPAHPALQIGNDQRNEPQYLYLNKGYWCIETALYIKLYKYIVTFYFRRGGRINI